MKFTVVSGTNIQFSTTTGFGGNFYLIGSSNIGLPMNQWSTLRTNVITARTASTYSATVISAGGAQFYLLQSY